MKRISSCLIILVMMYGAVQGQILARDKYAKKYIKQANLIYLPLKSAPFPHPMRAEGYTYHDQFFPPAQHYQDNTVLVIFPNYYRIAEKVDLIFFFHGWWNNIDSTIQTFNILEQFLLTKKNAWIIVPEVARKAPDSFGGKLEDPQGFKNLVKDVLDFMLRVGLIENTEVGDIILAGHSGAFQVISAILAQGGLTNQVKEVYLFDALYGQTERFLTWIEKSNGKLINIYTKDGGTKSETERLMATLNEKKIGFLKVSEEQLNVDGLKNNRLIFINSQLGHNEVIHKNNNLYRFLDASILKSVN